MDKFTQISQLMLDLAAEGVPQKNLDIHEAALVVLLSRARKLRQAERAMGEIGALLAAERLGCHRMTIYRRARKSHELRKHATA